MIGVHKIKRKEKGGKEKRTDQTTPLREILIQTPTMGGV
jgi:hypothetical protein